MLTRINEVNICLSGVFFLCIVLTSALEEEGEDEILSYNNTNKQLHFLCPKKPDDGGTMLSIKLYRGDVEMADWSWKKKAAVPKVDRLMTLPSASAHQLEAILSHVTCYDSATYKCLYAFDKRDAAPIHFEHTQTFVFDGVVSNPTLTAEPLQARYTVGDTLNLTCQARISQHANTWVWETRLPGEQFQPFTDHTTISSNVEGSCEKTSKTFLVHTISADDDNREWRCRLRLTNQRDLFVTAVRCVNDDSESCGKVGPTAMTELAESVTKANSQNSATNVNYMSSASTKFDSNTIYILVTVIAVLTSAMVIAVAIMTTMQKKRQKKHSKVSPSSGIFSDTSNNASSSRPLFTTNQSRILPLPPSTLTDFQHYPSPVPNHYDFHDDSMFSNDSEETSLKVVSHNATTASSLQSQSVYIPMSAVQEMGSGSNENKVRLQIAIGQPEKLSDGRNPGFGRSQSVYSNTEAVDGQRSSPNSSAASHESHVILGNLKPWKAECGPDFRQERLVS